MFLGLLTRWHVKIRSWHAFGTLTHWHMGTWAHGHVDHGDTHSTRFRKIFFHIFKEQQEQTFVYIFMGKTLKMHKISHIYVSLC